MVILADLVVHVPSELTQQVYLRPGMVPGSAWLVWIRLYTEMTEKCKCILLRKVPLEAAICVRSCSIILDAVTPTKCPAGKGMLFL